MGSSAKLIIGCSTLLSTRRTPCGNQIRKWEVGRSASTSRHLAIAPVSHGNGNLRPPDWVVVTRNADFLNQLDNAEPLDAIGVPAGLRVWTDDFDNLFQIPRPVKFGKSVANSLTYRMAFFWFRLVSFAFAFLCDFSK